MRVSSLLDAKNTMPMTIMKTFAITVMTISLAVISLLGCASNDRFATGVVRDISKDSIELDSPSGMISSIGFSCEPKVCDSTKNISVGNEVILRLGSENRKNKLLSIRKCHSDDKECLKTGKKEIQAHNELEEASEKFMREHNQCRENMVKDLASNVQYIPVSQSDKNSKVILEKYNKLVKDPNVKVCLEKVVHDHQSSVYNSCIKHGCGKNIGGGCSHITGYSLSNSVFKIAVEKCSI